MHARGKPGANQRRMMRFRVRCELDYSAEAPVVFLLNVRAQDNGCQKVLEENFSISPKLPHTLLTCPVTKNRFERIDAEVPGVYNIVYEAVVETRLQKLPAGDLKETSPASFGLDVLPFIYPSRYSQSDRMGRLAADHFGKENSAVETVQEIVAWISRHIAYVSGSTDANTSSVDTLVERAGVCRDFAHLGIAFCRAMNIPARYFTGYAFELEPPDFHACFETWIGGRWILWDATGLASPDGVVRIGTGRDAADVSVCTAFGSLKLERQSVECLALDPSYKKMTPEELGTTVVCHDAANPSANRAA
ncbi:transglutaminase-like putative cysteine protease [Roseimicrobium gellanilyticum]|uniref:Transglutaminase-like putative cysteine protease n=1 Tax=Roseimicrobium gellanilyticum TaxID=748857 RepID=A0A366HSG9_9BACT|nr:transglutaminase-like putative cysteine protease [Roseimicrobium gellanilyticum]